MIKLGDTNAPNSMIKLESDEKHENETLSKPKDVNSMTLEPEGTFLENRNSAIEHRAQRPRYPDLMPNRLAHFETTVRGKDPFK